MKTKFFPYTLTIGILVHNDGPRLRACLEGLAPLRKAVSCELVVTDLGSTDGTQEIAKEYADVFLEHEWNDDFSKARNTAVTVSKGRWFFYVDPDYLFDETILDIATFLSDKKQSKIYNSATVTLENHVKPQEEEGGTASSFYHIQRGLLVNFSGGKRFFKGAVHESIPTHGVAYPLKTIIKRSVPEDREAERERNITILSQQLEQEPEDLKQYIELTQELKDPVQKKQLFQAGLAKSKTLTTKNKDNVLWTAILYGRYLLFALQEEDWDLFDSLQEDWDNPFPQSIIDLNVQGMGLSACLKQQQHEEVMERFPAYQALFYQLKQTPDQLFSMIESFSYARSPYFYSVESNAIRCAVAYHSRHLSDLWLSQSDTYSFLHSNGTRAHLPNYCECVMITEQFPLVRKAYDYLKEHSTSAHLTDFFQEIEPFYHSLQGTDLELFLQEMEGVELPFAQREEEDDQEVFSIPLPSSPATAPVTPPAAAPLAAPLAAPAPAQPSSLPSLTTVKETLLQFLQSGDLPSATSLLSSALARFPEDPTLQALQAKLDL